jgi:hypothetical protein
MLGRVSTIAFISLMAAMMTLACWSGRSYAQFVVTDGLISYWPLDRDTIQDNKVKDIWGGQDATINGDPKVVEGKVGDALEFNGISDWLLVTDDITKAKLPKKEMTAEAWVYPEEFDSWGTFLGCFQDNGGFEKGWCLGTVNSKEGAGPDEFCIAISSVGADDGDGDLIYFHNGPYDAGKWYHVVGVYDGEKTKLYIDGKLVLDSKGQSGDINYPDHAFLVIGVYKDDNEHDPFKGRLDEIRLYDRALSEAEVLQNYTAEGLPVEPAGKLELTWGKIKMGL